MPHLC